MRTGINDARSELPADRPRLFFIGVGLAVPGAGNAGVGWLSQWACAAAALSKTARLIRNVEMILFIFAANVLQHVAVRDQVQGRLEAEGPCVILRIFEGNLQVDVPEIAPTIPF